MDITLKSLLRGGLLALFLLVPLAVFPLAFYSSQIKMVLLVGVVSLAALGWLWVAIVEERHAISLTLTNGVLAFNLLIWGVTLLASPYPNEGLPVVSARVAGLGLLLLTPALLQRKLDLQRVLALLLVAAALMSAFALLQFFRLDPFASAERKVGHFRVCSTTMHPNILITFLVACVPLNIAAFRLFARTTRNRVLLGLCLVLSLSAAAATLSRAGWAAMTVAVVLTVLGIWLGARGKAAEGKPAPSSSKAIWIVAALGLALAVALAVGLGSGLMDPGERERLLSLRGATTEKRVLIYKGAMRMAAEAPLLGKGLGTFSLFLPAYRTPELAMQFPRNEYYAEAAVSEPLEVLVESGALGLLAWLLLVGLMVGRPLRAIGRVSDPGIRALLAAAAAGTLGLVTHGMVEVSLRFLPPLMMFWALPGLALAAERVGLADQQPPSSGAPPRALQLGSWPLRLGLAAVVGMTFGLVFAVTLSDFIANIHVNLGERALKKGKVEQAEGSFRAAEATWTGNLPARYRRAYALWKLGHLAKAEQAYRQLIERSPNYFDVNHNLARVLFDSGKLKQAAAWTAKATKLNPYHVPSHELAVRLALRGGQLAEAERLASHTLKVAGDFKAAPNTARYVWSRLAMARVRVAQRRKPDARRLLMEALSADPRHKEARHLLGTLD